MTEPVGLGPIRSTQTQIDRAKAMLDEAVAEGARVLTGGTVDGPFFRPTVVVDVPRSSRLWNEEIFAPIAAVLTVDGDDEAVEVTNDSAYGLVCSVVGGDVHRAGEVARRLRASGHRLPRRGIRTI